jgi:hypothetical protein
MKPSRSPWLSKGEANILAQLTADIWDKPETIRKEWIVLASREQHNQFATFVSRIREAYMEMKRVSDLLFSRIGHRKQYIMAALKKDDTYVPNKKREKRNNFVLAASFWKLNMANLYSPVKLVFGPIHSYSAFYEGVTELVHDIIGEDGRNDPFNEIKALKSDAVGKRLLWIKLIEQWFLVFRPSTSSFKISSASKDFKPKMKDDNPFKVLEDESSEQLDE